MYLRWKSQVILCRRRPTGRYSLRAVLVESRRVNGKPRQRIVKYLGAICADRISDLAPRIHFWRAVRPRLDELALPRRQRQAVEEAIRRRVPCPTPKEERAYDQKLAELSAALRASLGRL